MELSALPRMQCAVSGLVQAWKVRPRKRAREREREGGRKFVSFPPSCWFVSIADGIEPSVKGEVTIEFGLRFRGDLAMVPMSQWIGLFVCAIASLSVCVCVCVSVHKHRHGRFYWADISPLFSLWAGGDWWLNCWVHVNSNCWFIEILRVSEGAPTKRERKRYRPFKLM